MKTKWTIQGVNMAKCWLLEKIKKIESPFSQIDLRKRRQKWIKLVMKRKYLNIYLSNSADHLAMFWKYIEMFK